MNKQVIEVLNKQVADWSVLFTKLHNFHWYVKDLNSSHYMKFEELYTESATHIDEIAERILAIGKPVATMKEYLEISSIQEHTEKLQKGWSKQS